VSHLRTAYLSCVACATAVLFTTVAFAQDAAEERSQSFQAVKGAVKEDVPGGPLLVWAYGLILLLMVGYLVRLVRLQQRSERELARLSQQLSKAGGS
jgi:type VI protein secretion system component VasF